MIEFYGPNWFFTYLSLRDMRETVRGIGTPGNPGPMWTRVGPSGELTDEEREYLHRLVDSFVTSCESLGMHSTALAAGQVAEYVSDRYVTPPMVHAALDGTLAQASRELGEQKFIFIPPDDRKYFESAQVLGREVWHSLQSTRRDVLDAGNCLAVGLDAAAVFHLMRVAEIAIREFFGAKGIVHPKRANLEDASWGELVTHLDTWLTNEIARLHALHIPRGTPAYQQMVSYGALISDARFLKDERDKTMHPRHLWTHPEAEHALARVGAFARRIAELIA